jgi:hypothetical protein
LSGNRVLLMTLSVRTSAKGNVYLAGWLGRASVVAFSGEPDKFGNETWDVFLAEPEPRDATPKPPARPPGREEPPAPPAAASSAGARPGASQAGRAGTTTPQRRFRREGARARQERVSGEVARGYGLEADPDDPLPF